MSNQLAVRDDMGIAEVAQAFVKSGYFSDAADVSKAVVKILAGREFGAVALAAVQSVRRSGQLIVNGGQFVLGIVETRRRAYSIRNDVSQGLNVFDTRLIYRVDRVTGCGRVWGVGEYDPRVFDVDAYTKISEVDDPSNYGTGRQWRLSLDYDF